jgi:CBS domain containing-hemolysin-like protein
MWIVKSDFSERIDFGGLKAREVMVPRTEMSVQETTDIKDLNKKF